MPQRIGGRAARPRVSGFASCRRAARASLLSYDQHTCPANFGPDGIARRCTRRIWRTRIEGNFGAESNCGNLEDRRVLPFHSHGNAVRARAAQTDSAHRVVRFSDWDFDFLRLVIHARDHEHEMARRGHAVWRSEFYRRLGLPVYLRAKIDGMRVWEFFAGGSFDPFTAGVRQNFSAVAN